MNNFKFICLLFIFLSCQETKIIKFDFVDQVLPSNKCFFTIEACEKGCSWFYLRKYNKNWRLIKELQWQDNIKLLNFKNDTLSVLLYVHKSIGSPSPFAKKDSIIKWGDEYVKYERIGISGYLQGEKDIIVNKFYLSNGKLLINGESPKLISLPIDEVRGTAASLYFIQNYVGEFSYSTFIKFSNNRIKEQFVKALEEYRKNLPARNGS